MEDWIKSALSAEQQSPLNRETANACILAGAGSGKTRTLVHLLAADLASGIDPSGIVAFTFTEKAAEELLARIHMLCRTYLPHINPTGMYVGTIHAWCFQYLYQQPEFYNFTTVDEFQVDALVSRLYDGLEIEKRYSKPYPNGINKFLADVEIFYNENIVLDQVPPKIRPSIEVLLKVLQDNQLLTFGGMVRNAIDCLQTNGPLSDLKALYVDEYQDVNPAQVALIHAMLPEDGRLVAVGDDLQCIYQWRGSDVSRILNFDKEFHDVSVHRLPTNYRARPQIVQFGNQVSSNIGFRDPEKIMVPIRENPDCLVIHWLSLGSEMSQAKAIVEIIENFRSKGIPYNKIAILLRSVLGSGRPIVDVLEGAKIPVQCPILSRGGPFIREFIIPVFNWLRTEHKEPKNKSEEDEAEQAANSLWQSARPWIPVSNSELVFWEGINGWLDLIETKHNDAYDVRSCLYNFLDRCGIYPSPDDSNMLVGLGIASQIIRSVEEIHRRRLKGHPRRTPQGVISEAYFSLLRGQENFGESLPIDTETDAVLVTTVHQAKGLEWPIVVLPMVVSRRFPVRNRSHNTSFPDEIAGRYGTTLEDERRLFYVAITRAKERLFLLDPVRNNPKQRSVFLRELQTHNVIEPCSLKEISSQVWKIRKQDLLDPDPPPLRVGLFDLLIYLECPYQFALRRVVCIQPSIGDELGFGRGLHELIQRRFKAEEKWTWEELREQVNQNVNMPYMSEESEAQSKKAIANHIKQLEHIGVFQSNVEPEVNIEIFLEDGIIHGIIDGIQTNSDGSVLVRDWKSNIHESFLPRYERQLQFYTYALRLQDKNVSKAHMVDVAASSSKKAFIAKEVDVSDSRLNSVIRSMEKALQGIRERNFNATPSDISCACCDMFKICSERQKDEITSKG